MQSSVSTKKVLVVAGIAAVVALICLWRARSRAAAERSLDPLLLDARLVRTVREPSQLSGEGKVIMIQTVAHVRFLAREGVPTGVFLPAGSRGGCALTFIPRLNDRYGLLGLYALSSVQGMWNPHEFESAIFKQDDDRFNAPDGDTGHDGFLSMSSEVGQYRPVRNWSTGCGDGEVGYEAQIKCDGRVPQEQIVHRYASLCRLQSGEELHELNCAIPAMMQVGVKLEDPVPVPAASERDDEQ